MDIVSISHIVFLSIANLKSSLASFPQLWLIFLVFTYSLYLNIIPSLLWTLRFIFITVQLNVWHSLCFLNVMCSDLFSTLIYNIKFFWVSHILSTFMMLDSFPCVQNIVKWSVLTIGPKFFSCSIFCSL